MVNSPESLFFATAGAVEPGFGVGKGGRLLLKLDVFVISVARNDDA